MHGSSRFNARNWRLPALQNSRFSFTRNSVTDRLQVIPYIFLSDCKTSEKRDSLRRSRSVSRHARTAARETKYESARKNCLREKKRRAEEEKKKKITSFPRESRLLSGSNFRARWRFRLLGNLSTRRFLRGDGNLLPIHVSRRHGQPSRLGADFVLLILTPLVKREFRLYDFRSFISFCPQFFVLIDA